MAKGRAKKLRVKKNGMEVEGTGGGGGGGGGGAAAGDWQTAPAGEGGADFIGMDTTDVAAGTAAAEAPAKQQQDVRPLAPAAKRGQTSKKQKERKRKSMEKAFAVSSRKETKFKAQVGTAEKKKVGKKLWTNDAKQ